MKIELYNLPKISLNEIYAGKHWRTRKKHKDNYKKIVKSQHSICFSKEYTYVVSYDFVFKNKPLDVSNTVYMLKMIEDILFEDDGYKIITELNIKSTKGKEGKVIVNIIKKQLV